MADPRCIPDARLGDFIESYEAAQVRDGSADPADFLPEPRHPLYRAVLRELIRVDLEYGWQRGRPCGLDEYQRRFPALRDDPDGLREIAFEEQRLRRQAAEASDPADDPARTAVIPTAVPRAEFPLEAEPQAVPELEAIAQAYEAFRQRQPDATDVEAWCASFGGGAEAASLFRDVHRTDPAAADRLAEAVTRMPQAGNRFLGFRLVRELGRGAFGRVFLAEQRELADRPVVLKIASDLGGEPQLLARLQHTNIVPIYSVHHARPFQAVCMPYLGALTLADVFRELASRGMLPASGRDLFSTLFDRQRATARTGEPGSSLGKGGSTTESPGEPAPEPGPARPTLEMLERFSYVQSVLWVTARLADGLGHAHERGILHRDLKPANVLLTDDGTPMLLDFNLSEDTRLRTSPSAAAIGGTLPYMAPEHLDAFEGKGRVDERSDLYALGLICYQLLTGRQPYTASKGPLHQRIAHLRAERLKGPPEVRCWNRSVSPAVEAIVRHCLEPDPARRYQSASQLREDLERQLEDLPLRHTPEPSLRERAGKWIRRHPRLTSSTTVAAVAAVLLGVLGTWFGIWAYVAAQRTAAQQALSLFDDEMRTARRSLTTRALTREKEAEGVAAARAALARFQVLDNPHWSNLQQVQYLKPAQREQLREDVGELLFLLSCATGREAAEVPDPAREERLAAALRLSEVAESCYGADEAPPALWDARAEILQALRRGDEAARLHEKAGARAPQRPREFYLQAVDQSLRDRYRQAVPLLREATRREPRNYWAWFILGVCYDRLDERAEAVACYSACVALAPEDPWAYFNRGLARGEQRQYGEAHADFEQAVRLQPDQWEFHLNRALAAYDLKQYQQAEAGFTRALLLGAPQSRIYFLRARARHQLGDRDGAARDEAEGLAREPRDEDSWVARGLYRLNVKKDRRGAVADFKKALEVNPQHFPAWQNIANVRGEDADGLADAIAAETRALTIAPNFAWAWSGRGVLLARKGNRVEAHADAQQALKLDTEPATLYQVACIYALTSRQQAEDRAQAFELLSAALRKGYGLDLLKDDPDLNPIRDDPEFRRLEQAAQAFLQRKAGPK
jgi:serine/threonine protein kinase/Flp pilus assembly protein TadD